MGRNAEADQLNKGKMYLYSMKQLLFISAGKAFPEGAFAFLQFLRQQESFHVKGLFFSPIDYGGIYGSSYVPGSATYVRTKDKERQVVADQKSLFARRCEEANIHFQLHENDEPWSKQLVAKESRFADLVVVSGEAFYAELDAEEPNLFLHEALRETESPILVVPENYTTFDQLFFAYDGSKESLHAMKQFSYLFPQFSSLPAEVVYIKDEEAEGLPDIDLLKEYVGLRYDNIGFSKLHFKASDLFPTWIADKQNVLLVSGSFGRSSISYMTKRSFAERVIRDHKLPIFIAHF
jgi:hypothetical protein